MDFARIHVLMVNFCVQALCPALFQVNAHRCMAMAASPFGGGESPPNESSVPPAGADTRYHSGVFDVDIAFQASLDQDSVEITATAATPDQAATIRMLSEATSSDARPVARAITAHAKKLLRPGEYLSLSDWLAYGWATETQITIIVGRGQWRLFDFMAPQEVSDKSKTWSKHLHVIACRVGSPAKDWSQVNHWVYGLPNEDIDMDHAPENDESLLARLPTAPSLENDLVSYYSQLGYVVGLTVAQGDCGADTICQSEGPIPRTYSSIPPHILNRECVKLIN